MEYKQVESKEVSGDSEDGSEITNVDNESRDSMDDPYNPNLQTLIIKLLDNTTRSLSWNFDQTTPRDVISSTFKNETSKNYKILLIFAGKIMNEDKTLTDYGVKDNYCLHAMVKNGGQQTSYRNNDQEEEK